MSDTHVDLGGGLSLSWHVAPGYDQVEVVAQWQSNGQLHRSMRREAIGAMAKSYNDEQKWLAAMSRWAREEQKNYMAPSNWYAQNMNTTSATNNSMYYPQQTYVEPPRWHNFPCGHQVKLEPGQPLPMVCPTCGPVVMETYTYEKCGHPYSHQKNIAVPSACPECARLTLAAEREQKLRDEELAAEAKRREDEAKDPIAWLDRELGDVYATL